MLVHSPSKIAAAAVNVAVRTIRGGGASAWTSAAVRASGYSHADLHGTVLDLEAVVRASREPHVLPFPPLIAVDRKYSLPRYGEVSSLPIATLSGRTIAPGPKEQAWIPPAAAAAAAAAAAQAAQAASSAHPQVANGPA